MAAEKPAPVKEFWPKDHFRKPLMETPFHDRIAALMRTGTWYGWGGYTVASVIEDKEVEYFAIRNAATLFDISPMVKYRISGPDAEAYLNRLTLRDVAGLAVGRVHYTAWCDDDGKVLDDGTLFRLSDWEFRLCCQERHLPWLLDSTPGFEVAVEEVTHRIAGLALQGPTSCSVLRRAGFADVETLVPFEMRNFSLPGANGVEVLISRTGFTGDLGYELFVPSDQATALWDVLWKAGRLHGLCATGFAAVDIARIEAGFIMARSDFIPSEHAVRENRRRSPFEIGLDWMVDFGKGHFNGRRALEEEKRRKSSRYVLVGLEIDGNEPAPNAIVYHGKTRRIGVISAAAWSPTAKRNIAIASLERPYGVRKTDDLWVEIYAMHELQYTKLMMRARVVERPFLKLDRRRATPPAEF